MSAFVNAKSSGMLNGSLIATALAVTCSGSNRAAVVWTYGGSAYANSITWAGAGTISVIDSRISSQGYYVRKFLVLDPPTASTNVSANWTSVQGNLAVIVQIANSTVGPLSVDDFGHVDEDSGLAQSVHNSVGSSSGGILFGFALQGNIGSTPDFVAYGTEDVRVNENNGSYDGIGAVSKTASAGSTDFGIGDANNAAAWIFDFVSLKETAGGGATVTSSAAGNTGASGQVTSGKLGSQSITGNSAGQGFSVASKILSVAIAGALGAAGTVTPLSLRTYGAAGESSPQGVIISSVVTGATIEGEGSPNGAVIPTKIGLASIFGEQSPRGSDAATKLGSSTSAGQSSPHGQVTAAPLVASAGWENDVWQTGDFGWKPGVWLGMDANAFIGSSSGEASPQGQISTQKIRSFTLAGQEGFAGSLSYSHLGPSVAIAGSTGQSGQISSTKISSQSIAGEQSPALFSVMLKLSSASVSGDTGPSGRVTIPAQGNAIYVDIIRDIEFTYDLDMGALSLAYDLEREVEL
jgi:hypothetical protein